MSDNLIALLMIALADLTTEQRSTLTNMMAHKNLKMPEYRTDVLRDIFVEHFCTTKTSIDNPLINTGQGDTSRSFMIYEYGEMEGESGYWAVVEEDDAQIKCFTRKRN